MLKTILNVLLVSILVFAISGCAQLAAPTVDPNAIGTAIAQTMAAYSPTSSPVPTATVDESPTLTSTVTTVPTVETPSPTATIVASFTSTPISLMTATQPASLTPVPISPGTVQVTVSVPTNCRVGPGVLYARTGALRVGEVAEVVGRHSNRDYWIIRLPGNTNQTCWLWGQYATVTGDTNVLPIFTPPVPPATATLAPSFDVAYEGLESCAGTGWWIDLGLENVGTISFRSITFTIEDRDTDVSLTQRANGFINKNGCSETETRESLGPDVSRTVSSPVLTANPTGHRLRATITVCSNTGQSGTCVTQTVNVTP